MSLLLHLSDSLILRASAHIQHRLVVHDLFEIPKQLKTGFVPSDYAMAEVERERAKKSRASLACHVCRARKIKCDVVLTGIPCGNCRELNKECVTSVTKRRKRFLAENGPGRNITLQRPDNARDRQHTAWDLPGFKVTEPSFLGQTKASKLPPGRSSQPAFHCFQTDASADDDLGLVAEQGQSPAFEADLQADLLASSSYPGFFFMEDDGLNLPPYVRAPPASLDAEDGALLSNKGAFSIPGTQLRNELLRSYVKCVHPFMPLLDIQDFLHKIQNEDSSHQISLLVFQAVMFAATAFIDLKLVLAEGYSDRKTMRRAFFQKAKVRTEPATS